MGRRVIGGTALLVGLLVAAVACGMPTPSVPTVFDQDEPTPDVEFALATDVVVSYPRKLNAGLCSRDVAEAVVGGRQSDSLCLSVEIRQLDELQAAVRRSLLGAGWRRERDELTFEEFVRGNDKTVVSVLERGVRGADTDTYGSSRNAVILIVRTQGG